MNAVLSALSDAMEAEAADATRRVRQIVADVAVAPDVHWIVEIPLENQLWTHLVVVLSAKGNSARGNVSVHLVACACGEVPVGAHAAVRLVVVAAAADALALLAAMTAHVRSEAVMPIWRKTAVVVLHVAAVAAVHAKGKKIAGVAAPRAIDDVIYAAAAVVAALVQRSCAGRLAV